MSSSGGNAGVAIAYAGKQLGIPTTVVVPSTTQPLMRERIESYGATVIVEGAAWDQADQYARALVEEKGGTATVADDAQRCFGTKPQPYCLR